jgi:hypothetical protein
MFDVEFSPDGSFAYRPGEILLPTSSVELARTIPGFPAPRDSKEAPEPPEGYKQFIPGWAQVTGVTQVLDVVEALRRRGIPAQPNHVLFATCACGCGCGPHPADPRANPYYANPYYANPYYANPYYANPYYANPYYANPYYANPYYANPHAANPNPGLSGAAGAESEPDPEPRKSSARPAEAPEGVDLGGGEGSVRVTVLDTGFAGAFAPQLAVNANSEKFDVPDTAEENQPIGQIPPVGDDGFLDPAAGHGTFIAGVIRQLTEVCDITVKRVLTTFGAGDEAQIATELSNLPTEPENRPHFVNLSFGGYSPYGMRPLAEAIEQLIEAKIVVVASAGNDATCLPMYPAAIPGVIGVAALDEHDTPASFTNFGPWVRACTRGVDVVSTFFDWTGSEKEFDGWAEWSGTSFAAPRVVAALAEEFAPKVEPNGAPDPGNQAPDPYDAVKTLIDDPEKVRLPMMGTLVEPEVQSGWDWVKIATKKKTPQQP